MDEETAILLIDIRTDVLENTPLIKQLNGSDQLKILALRDRLNTLINEKVPF